MCTCKRLAEDSNEHGGIRPEQHAPPVPIPCFGRSRISGLALALLLIVFLYGRTWLWGCHRHGIIKRKAPMLNVLGASVATYAGKTEVAPKTYRAAKWGTCQMNSRFLAPRGGHWRASGPGDPDGYCVRYIDCTCGSLRSVRMTPQADSCPTQIWKQLDTC